MAKRWVIVETEDTDSGICTCPSCHKESLELLGAVRVFVRLAPRNGVIATVYDTDDVWLQLDRPNVGDVEPLQATCSSCGRQWSSTEMKLKREGEKARLFLAV